MRAAVGAVPIERTRGKLKQVPAVPICRLALDLQAVTVEPATHPLDLGGDVARWRLAVVLLVLVLVVLVPCQRPVSVVPR